MKSFYAEILVWIDAKSEDDARNIAEAISHEIKTNGEYGEEGKVTTSSVNTVEEEP